MSALRNCLKGIMLLLLLSSLLATEAGAQGYRLTFGIWGGGPYMDEGCQMVKLNPMPDGRIYGLMRYPNDEADYLFTESKPNRLITTAESSDAFQGDRHLFAHDLYTENGDTAFVLEDGYPSNGGPFTVTLCKYFAEKQFVGTYTYNKFRSLWRTTIFQADGGKDAFAHAFEVLPDGFVSLCSREDLNAPGNFDLVLLKTDFEGQVLWTKTYPTPQNDYGIEIRPSADGGFFLLKGIRSATPETYAFSLLKVDATGNLLWEQALSQPGASELAQGLYLAADGNLLLSGVSHSNGLDPFVLKIDPAGAQLWRRDLAMPQRGCLQNHIIEDQQQNIVLAATVVDSTAANETDIFMLKLDADGNALKEVNLGRPGRDDVANALELRHDGTYIMGGYVVGPTASVLRIAMLMKTDTAGVIKAGRIEGNVFDDQNVDCLASAGEAPMSGWKIKAFQDSVRTFYGVTDALGNYSIPCDTGNYILSLIPPNVYWQVCANDIPITVGYLDTVTQDFGVQSLLDCPFMTIDHEVNRMRPCDTTTFTVNYCNQGTVAAENAYVVMTLEPELDFLESQIPPSAVNGDTLIFPLGTVVAGACGVFTFKAKLDCATPEFAAVCSEAHIYPDSLCLPEPLGWSGAYIVANGVCDGDSVRFTIKNIGAQPMAQPLEYIVIEDAVLLKQQSFQLAPGETMPVALPAVGTTYHLIADQEPNAPGNGLPIAAVEACTGSSGNAPSFGFTNQFPFNEAEPFISVGCWLARTSFDPNDKQAEPLGFGEAHHVFANTEIEYTIRFQNTGSDTAYKVVLIDTLSNFLDPATVRPGASSHPYRFEMDARGTLRFEFTGINLPHKAVNEAASQGFVHFRVAQRRDNPVGTRIENQAGIYFDYNLPILTNTTWHTVHEPWIRLVTAAPEGPNTTMQLQVAPNPMSTWALLTLKTPVEGEKQLVLYDVQGRELRREVFAQNQLLLQRHALPAGVYFYKVTGAAGILAQGRLVVE